MVKSEYQNMFAAEDTYWWFVAKGMYLRKLLDDSRLSPEINRVLDLGSGTGGVHTHLRSLGKVVALDNASEALLLSRKRGTALLAQANAGSLPFKAGSFSMVTALDLFEHIYDDYSAAKEITRVMESGGRFVISVPAHPTLIGPHDEALGHVRRYTKQQLKRLLVMNGFEVERITYTYFSSSPAMLTFKLIQKYTPGKIGFNNDGLPSYEIGATMNALMKALSVLDCWLMDRMNLPVGMSILALARKL